MQRVQLDEGCEHAFQELKYHLSQILLLAKTDPGERLYVYLAVSEHAVSSILIKDQNGMHLSVYYVSKRIIDAETGYPETDNLALALIVLTCKLLHYYLEHPITVLTSFPIKSILRRPEVSGRLVKWALELTQFDITY